MEKLSVVSTTCREELRDANADWIRLCAHPEAHPAFIEAVCETDEVVVRPHVVIARRGAEPVALAVARIEHSPVPITLGYAQIAAPKLKVVKLSYRGIAGDLSPDVLAVLWEGLSEPLRSGEAHAVFFDNVETGSVLDALSAAPPRGFARDFAPLKRNMHWVIDVPDSYERYCAALPRKTRYNLGRARKRIEAEFGPRLSVTRESDMVAYERVLADTEAVARLTYHRKLGVGFLNDARSRRLIRAGIEISAFRAYTLFIDGEPKAFWHSLRWRDTIFTTNTGYDPELAKLGIGAYLLQRLIEDACADPQVRRVDLGFGDAPYKREVCSAHWEECERFVLARSPRALGVNLARGAVMRVARAADHALSRLGVRERVKALWRSRKLRAGGDALESTTETLGRDAA